MKKCELMINKEQTTAIKGLLAILVVLCHLRSYITIVDSNFWLHKIFVAFGYLSVGCFFFLSGYGLNIQYKKKKDYMQNFVKNRIFPFYIKYLIILFAYIALFAVSGNGINIPLLCKSFFIGGTLVINGWYLQASLLLYVLFFFSFRFTKKHRHICMLLGIIGYMILCIAFNFGSHWYQSVCCFLIGIFYCEIHDSKYNFTLWHGLIAALLFVAITFCSMINTNPYLNVLLVTVSSSLMILLMGATPLKQKLNSIILRKIGEISLELYAVHGAIITILRSSFIWIKNDFLFVAVVLGLSFIGALIFSKILKLSNKLIKKRAIFANKQ